MAFFNSIFYITYFDFRKFIIPASLGKVGWQVFIDFICWNISCGNKPNHDTVFGGGVLYCDLRTVL